MPAMKKIDTLFHSHSGNIFQILKKRSNFFFADSSFLRILTAEDVVSLTPFKVSREFFFKVSKQLKTDWKR